MRYSPALAKRTAHVAQGKGRSSSSAEPAAVAAAFTIRGAALESAEAAEAAAEPEEEEEVELARSYTGKECQQ